MLRHSVIVSLCSALWLVLGTVSAEEPATKPAAASSSTVNPAHKADKTAAKTDKKPVEKKLAAADLSATQIVDKHLAARGGVKAWHAIKAMTLTGKMDVGQPVKKVDPPTPNEIHRPLTRMERIQAALAAEKDKEKPGVQVQVPFTMDMQRPRKTRTEIEFQGEKALQVYDGEKGWKVRPYLGRRDVEAYSDSELKLAATEAELDGHLINHAAKGNKIAVLGMEPVDGKKAYKLKVTLSDGQIRYIWIDAKTFLEVKIGEIRHLGGKDRLVATLLSNYKTVNGVKIPFVTETRIEGVKAAKGGKIYIEKVTLNPKFDDKHFAKPN